MTSRYPYLASFPTGNQHFSTPTPPDGWGGQQTATFCRTLEFFALRSPMPATRGYLEVGWFSFMHRYTERNGVLTFFSHFTSPRRDFSAKRTTVPNHYNAP